MIRSLQPTIPLGAFEQTKQALLRALEETRPVVDAKSCPSSISFVVHFDTLTGEPRKVIWRSESARDLTEREPRL